MRDDVEEKPERRSLTPGYRRKLALIGGLAGAVIGPTGLYLYASAAVARLNGDRPGSGRGMIDWSSMMSRLTTHRYGWLAIVLAFVATVLMMVPMIKWLEARAERRPGPYYRRAAFAGIAVGFGATALLTLVFFIGSLVIGATGSRAGVGAGEAGALAVGGVVFGGVAALTVPILFLPYIALFGIPFGLAMGWAIRRGGSPSQ